MIDSISNKPTNWAEPYFKVDLVSEIAKVNEVSVGMTDGFQSLLLPS